MASLPKVLLTILHQGWIRPEMLSVASAIQADTRVRGAIHVLNVRPYENALNTARKLALEGNFDYLITFDHDNVPLKNPLDLVFLNKDIIGMPYPSYRYNEKHQIEFALLAMDKQPNGEYLDHKTQSGLQEVDAIASGAMVITRRVLEHPDVFFTRKWDDQGMASTGVDFYYCEKAKQAGFSIYAHYDYPADHFKELSLHNLLT